MAKIGAFANSHEPAPDNFKIFQKNVHQNNLSGYAHQKIILQFHILAGSSDVIFTGGSNWRASTRAL